MSHDDETMEKIQKEMHQFCARLSEKYDLESCACLAVLHESNQNGYSTEFLSVNNGNLYASKYAARRFSK